MIHSLDNVEAWLTAAEERDTAPQSHEPAGTRADG